MAQLLTCSGEAIYKSSAAFWNSSQLLIYIFIRVVEYRERMRALKIVVIETVTLFFFPFASVLMMRVNLNQLGLRVPLHLNHVR